MGTVSKFFFSHNDKEESAKETKYRLAKAEVMCEKQFVKLIGKFAYRGFVNAFGELGKTYKSESVIYVNIGGVDYIFTQ